MLTVFRNHWLSISVLVGLGILSPAFILLSRKAHTTPPAVSTPQDKGLMNLRAFLIMIQLAEGTYGANAYRTLYGGSTFTSYANHPKIAITKGGITSTAAGAYQILYGTWVSLQQQLSLSDFSPASQDRAAIELIRQKGALEDVVAGRFVTAINKCRKVWASLPGAGYGQGERSMASLIQAFITAGGTVAQAA